MNIEIAGKYDRPPLWHRMRGRQCPSAAPVTRTRAALLAVFVPFAAGYFLSYWIRTINGAVSDGLVDAFGIGPRDLGLLTSLYFLTFAAMQLPAGMLIDRYGPRRVQAALFLVAAAGALVFAGAQGRGGLMLGRALIGLGCSAALATGIKALALWLPPERRALGNCCLVMCGGLGAMASAAPVGFGPGDWRNVFLVLGIACLAVALLVWLVVPEHPAAAAVSGFRDIQLGLWQVLRDRRFWRVAPLSATVVGTAFAIHGLWAARWLADAEGFGAPAISCVLLTMGGSLTLGALSFGVLATRLRRHGIPTTALFATASAAFLAIQSMIALGAPVPPMILLGGLAMFGAITVLSFTILGELFPTELAGRANGALNMLHLGTAFAMQAGIGAVIACWPVAPPLPPHRRSAYACRVRHRHRRAGCLTHLVHRRTRAPGPRPPGARLVGAATAGPAGSPMMGHDHGLQSRPLSSQRGLRPEERRAVRHALVIAIWGLALLVTSVVGTSLFGVGTGNPLAFVGQ